MNDDYMSQPEQQPTRHRRSARYQTENSQSNAQGNAQNSTQSNPNSGWTTAQGNTQTGTWNVAQGNASSASQGVRVQSGAAQTSGTQNGNAQTSPAQPTAQNGYQPVIGQMGDVPDAQGSASVYTKDNVSDQRRRSLQQPQQTGIYTRMTQTGYQQTVRQQPRTYAQPATAKPAAQYNTDGQPRSVSNGNTTIYTPAAQDSQRQRSVNSGNTANYTRTGGEEEQPRPRFASKGNAASVTRSNVRPEQRDEEYERRMEQRRDLDDDYDDEDDEPRRSVGKTILIVVLFLLVLLIGVYFLLPEGNTGVIGKLNEVKSGINGMFTQVKGMISPTEQPAQAYEFKSATLNGTVGTRSLFNLTTSQNVNNVRLMDEDGNEIVSSVSKTNGEGETNRVWEITVIFDTPYTGNVFASLKQGDEWVTTDKSLFISFTEATATPAPTETPTAIPTEPPIPSTETPIPVTDAPVSESAPLVVMGSTVISQSAAPVVTDAPETMAEELSGSNDSTEDYTDDTADEYVEEAVDEFTDEEGAGLTPDDTADDYAEEAVDEFTDEEGAGLTPDDTSADDWTEEITDDAEALSEANGGKAVAEETAEPTAVPTPTIAPTEVVLTATPMPLLTASSENSSLKITDTVFIGAKAQNDYQREPELTAVNPDNYTYWAGGVLTFRSDSFRRNAAFGTAEISEDKMSILWQSEIGSLKTADGTLYGVGWTGQPAIVKWSRDVREIMNISDEKKAVTALKEVIFSAQDGKVYFLDLNDGQQTRDPISVGYPLKGSVSVDTSGKPMISFGQGVSKMAGGKTGAIGFYLYNLIDCKQLMFINGRKGDNQKQYGSNGAFDGSSLMLWNADAMVIAGENGLFYTVKLNTDFAYESDPATLTVNPSTVYLRSKAEKAKDSQVSIESSIAMYDHYVYMADNYGALRCVDVNTMSTVWAADMGDNTDAAIALDFDDEGSLWLYTGNTNASRLGSKKNVSARRINAMTGEIDWTFEIKCKQDKKTEQSGFKASPVIGENSIDHLVIFTANKVDEGGSTIVALNKETGEVAWQYHLNAEAISSPVAVYNEAGDAWLIQADKEGTLHMLDAQSGAYLSSLDLGGEIQGSPAVYKDTLVIGTCSKGNSYMYGIKLE